MLFVCKKCKCYADDGDILNRICLKCIDEYYEQTHKTYEEKDINIDVIADVFGTNKKILVKVIKRITLDEYNNYIAKLPNGNKILVIKDINGGWFIRLNQNFVCDGKCPIEAIENEKIDCGKCKKHKKCQYCINNKDKTLCLTCIHQMTNY